MADEGRTVELAAGLPEAIRRYFAAWNQHDPEGVVAALAPAGTYQDPALPEALSGPALAGYVQGFLTAFPDVAFELVGAASGHGDTAAVQWLMRGTNTGPLRPGAPPTGGSAALPGVDIFTLAGGAIRAVQGYFDQQLLMQQLGLKVLAQPAAIGPLSFGMGAHLSLGNQAKPGAFSTTWIDARTEAEETEVITASQKIFQELAQLPGFIGANFTVIGNRLTTQVAWADATAASQILRLPPHRDVLHRFFGEDFASAVHTSVWVPERQNPLWIRCPACGQLSKAEDAAGQCRCGQPLPEQPAYW